MVVVKGDGAVHSSPAWLLGCKLLQSPERVVDSPDPWTSRAAVFERERTDTQTDIEFDFFDESPTVEGPTRDDAPPKKRRMPTRPPSGGTQGLFRLGVLIAAAILLAVILVLWVNSCRAGQKRAEYQDYMEAVSARATESGEIGKDLTTLLTTPGIKFADLRADLDGLRQQQAQVVASARQINPPGALREQQESLIEALQFRVSGLDGLAQGFATVQATTDTALTGRRLAEQASRLIASDVIYDDLFKEGAAAVLDREGIQGVEVPDSNFLANQDLVTATAWKLIVDRLTASPTAGQLRGNQISAVRVQPGDQTTRSRPRTASRSRWSSGTVARARRRR
jgi:hypothetical protein